MNQVVKDKHSTGLNLTAGTMAWVVAAITLGYMLPWAIAVSRGKTNSTGIFLLNALLGWTFIGWVIALVMGCSAHQIVPTSYYQQPVQTLTMGAAGWYPQGDLQRYWDGAVWTEHTAPR